MLNSCLCQFGLLGLSETAGPAPHSWKHGAAQERPTNKGRVFHHTFRILNTSSISPASCSPELMSPPSGASLGQSGPSVQACMHDTQQCKSRGARATTQCDDSSHPVSSNHHSKNNNEESQGLLLCKTRAATNQWPAFNSEGTGKGRTWVSEWRALLMTAILPALEVEAAASHACEAWGRAKSGVVAESSLRCVFVLQQELP